MAIWGVLRLDRAQVRRYIRSMYVWKCVFCMFPWQDGTRASERRDFFCLNNLRPRDPDYKSNEIISAEGRRVGKRRSPVPQPSHPDCLICQQSVLQACGESHTSVGSTATHRPCPHASRQAPEDLFRALIAPSGRARVRKPPEQICTFVQAHVGN